MSLQRAQREQQAPTQAGMTLDDGWQVLERTGWLATCSKQVQGKLLTVARIEDFASGDYLYRSGDEANGVFGLVSGALDALIPRLDGEEIVIHRALPGFWVGDLAMIASQERLISLRAAKPTKVVHLPQKNVLQLIDEDPDLLRDFFRLTHENVSTTFALLSNLAIPGARNRVALRLLIQHQLLADEKEWIEIGQELLAELVALSPQSVRRALRELESRALIELGYRRIRIIDKDALARLCGYST